jgi:hypothetical protein
MARWLLRLLSWSLVVVVCLSTELKAQTTASVTLTGVVTDQTNAVVPNAETKLRDLAKSTIRSTRTIHAEKDDASAAMQQKRISEVPNPGNDLTGIVRTTPGIVMNTDVPNAPERTFLFSECQASVALRQLLPVPPFHLCRADI